MCALVQNIDVLSDDDSQCLPSLGTKQPCKPIAKRKPAKRRHLEVAVRVPTPDGRSLRNRVEGQCGCLCECFVPFRTITQFEKLLKVRKEIMSLEKLEQDNYAQSSEKSIDVSGVRGAWSWSLDVTCEREYGHAFASTC